MSESQTIAVNANEIAARQTIEMSPEQYNKWRLTGEVPEQKPAAAEAENKEDRENATAAPPETAAEKETTETAPAAPPKKTAEQRIPELLAERKKDRQELADLRARLAKLEQRPGPQDEAAPKPATAAAPAERAKPKPTDLDAKGQPKYASYEDYIEDLAAWKSDQLVTGAVKEFREQSQAAERQRSAQTAQQRWETRAAEARKAHADFDEVALDPALPIPAGSIVHAYVLESDAGPEVLYYLGQNPDRLAEISKMTPIGQTRALRDIEIQVAPSATPAAPPPAVPKTAAPPPVRGVGGRNAAPTDEVEAALEKGDTRAYMAAANKRDIEKRKAGLR